MEYSNFNLEKELLKQGYGLIIGIDEAGRGPLAGPVVVCAATIKNIEILNPKSETNSKLKIQNSNFFDLVRDSKTLSEKQREKLFDFIQEHFFVGVGLCGHETIDRMNILEASFLAMKKAINDLSRIVDRVSKIENRFVFRDMRTIILVDGNKKIPNLSMDQRAIVGGDKIVKSISAASIIAKVTRDRIMEEMDGKYPVYGFGKHKGYGTKFHVEALMKNGPCEIHRKTFEPIKTLLKKTSKF